MPLRTAQDEPEVRMGGPGRRAGKKRGRDNTARQGTILLKVQYCSSRAGYCQKKRPSFRRYFESEKSESPMQWQRRAAVRDGVTQEMA